MSTHNRRGTGAITGEFKQTSKKVHRISVETFDKSSASAEIRDRVKLQ